MYESAQHRLYFSPHLPTPHPTPVSPQQMPRPPVSFWPAQPCPGIPGRGQAAANMWLQRNPGLEKQPVPLPSTLLCKAVSCHWSWEPAQGLWKDQRKLSKPGLLPSSSCHWIWQDASVTQEPQELAGSELTVSSWLSRWGGASPGPQGPPAASSASWTETSHPSRAKPSFSCKPLRRPFPMAYYPSSPAPHPLIEGPLRTLIPGSKNYQLSVLGQVTDTP